MYDNMTFCEECMDDVTYTVEDREMTSVLKGETYTYMGKVAYCSECGAEIYVPEINDYNLKALYDAFRERNGIITLEKILELPVKYAIGKRPLSLLLGWGELTFSRYCDGDMPTKQYSDVLSKIYDEPEYYAWILEENKTNLKSASAYEKSKKAVDMLIMAKEAARTDMVSGRISDVIEYLLGKCEDITPLALQKVLYYIQGFYYAFYGQYIFKEDCEAWVHGPVYREVYSAYKDYRYDSIAQTVEYDMSMFSSAEKSVMDSVIKNICCYSGKVLEEFTHAETPWLTARGGLSASESSHRIIDKALIGSYFKEVKEKYNMISPADIKAYTQKMFEQI